MHCQSTPVLQSSNSIFTMQLFSVGEKMNCEPTPVLQTVYSRVTLPGEDNALYVYCGLTVVVLQSYRAKSLHRGRKCTVDSLQFNDAKPFHWERKCTVSVFGSCSQLIPTLHCKIFSLEEKMHCQSTAVLQLFYYSLIARNLLLVGENARSAYSGLTVSPIKLYIAKSFYRK